MQVEHDELVAQTEQKLSLQFKIQLPSEIEYPVAHVLHKNYEAQTSQLLIVQALPQTLLYSLNPTPHIEHEVLLVQTKQFGTIDRQDGRHSPVVLSAR